MIATRRHKLMLVGVATVVAIATVNAGGWLAASAGERATTKRVACKSAGKTITADADGRVYQQSRGEFADFYWACLYSTGRAYRLDREPSLNNVRLDRRRVAYAVASCEVNDCEGDYIAVRNLRTGVLRRLDLPAETAPNEITRGDFELTSSGTVVFISVPPDATRANPRFAVYAFRSGGSRQLDSGAVDQGSLAVKGNRVYWTKNGSPQTTTLGP